MKYRESAVSEVLQRVQPFLADNRESFAEADPEDFARAQQKVDEVLARLMTFGLDQDAGSRGAIGETARQRQLRLDLSSEWLKPIAVIARRNLRQVPEFAALQLPKASSRGHGFTASARGMAVAAAAHRETLVAYGLPESFVEDLNKAVDELEASHSDRESNRTRRVAATKGLEQATREARTVLAVLDALVRRWAKGNETLLRQWEGVRLVRRRPGPLSVTAPSAASNANDAAPSTGQPLAMAGAGA